VPISLSWPYPPRPDCVSSGHCGRFKGQGASSESNGMIGLSIAVREQSGSLRSLTLTHRMQIAPYIALYVGLALLFGALVLVLVLRFMR